MNLKPARRDLVQHRIQHGATVPGVPTPMVSPGISHGSPDPAAARQGGDPFRRVGPSEQAGDDGGEVPRTLMPRLRALHQQGKAHQGPSTLMPMLGLVETVRAGGEEAYLVGACGGDGGPQPCRLGTRRHADRPPARRGIKGCGIRHLRHQTGDTKAPPRCANPLSARWAMSANRCARGGWRFLQAVPGPISTRLTLSSRFSCVWLVRRSSCAYGLGKGTVHGALAHLVLSGGDLRPQSPVPSALRRAPSSLPSTSRLPLADRLAASTPAPPRCRGGQDARDMGSCRDWRWS